MNEHIAPQTSTRGRWLALTAALLGWMFDGFEMGLFPLVARSAIQDLLPAAEDAVVGKWMGLATALFLVGAATGGVLFGWLGDRIGRVRAMTLSVIIYAVFTGLCGLAQSPEQIAGLRFLSALGMGGEWSLGVALVMEIWPDRSRAFLAGLIGAAANVGFLLVGVIGMLLPPASWRIILVTGAAPALLAFLIRLFVPESTRWQEEQQSGRTSNWATRDLIGVVLGAMGVLLLVFLWTEELPMLVRIAGSLFTLTFITICFLYPVVRYVQRRGSASEQIKPVRRMLLGAGLGGVALLGTWASIQWAPVWAAQLAPSTNAPAYTAIFAALGAILGTIGGALMGNVLGRRMTYFLLCVGSLAASLFFFRMNRDYDLMFRISAFFAGALTASFYGWLPLYLPELFPSALRASGQGFSFNFGRIIAAVGALQTGFLMQDLFKNDYAKACSTMSLIYLVGMVLIWFAPETKGQPLPE